MPSGKFALPYPDGFDEYKIVACGIHEQDHFGSTRSDPTEDVTSRARPNKGARVSSQLRHARLIAHDATAAERTAGIDGYDTHLMTSLDQMHAQLVDKGAFPYTRRTTDRYACCSTRVRQHGFQERPTLRDIFLAPALH